MGLGSVASQQIAVSSPRSPPTIKGIFVNSHVKAVGARLGPEGLARLELAFGRPLTFRNGEDVPVADEIRIIELALDLLGEAPDDPAARHFEAGRLHFRNFTTTPWATVLFTLLRRNFRYMTLHSDSIAERVFQGIKFQTVELGPTAVKVVMENTPYPIQHFQGLFYEWMVQFELPNPRVAAQRPSRDRYEYVIQWG